MILGSTKLSGPVQKVWCQSRTEWQLIPLLVHVPGIDERETDRQLSADLTGDPKEVAEHRMLVDLGRNDIGAYRSKWDGRSDQIWKWNSSVMSCT